MKKSQVNSLFTCDFYNQFYLLLFVDLYYLFKKKTGYKLPVLVKMDLGKKKKDMES
jgi:hypothetical protein